MVNRLTHNDLGGGYLLWHSIVNDISRHTQSLPQVSDNGTGGRLCAFQTKHSKHLNFAVIK